MTTAIKISNQLEKLEQKKQQLAAQIKLVESRQKAQARKEDTRRKILVGAYYIKQAEAKGEIEQLYHNVREYVKRDNDKRLFDA